MSVGAGILAAGEISRAENIARREVADAYALVDEARAERRAAEEETRRLSFVAKSQVHNLRGIIDAHELAEDMLIAALKDENPVHPLADRDAIDIIVTEKRAVTMLDPKTIKRTYPDGVIPEGSIPYVDGRPFAIGGEPGHPRPVKNYAAILKAFKLTDETVNDPEVVRVCVSNQERFAQELKDKLAADDKKGFFTSMNKKKRAEMENNSGWADSYLSQLKTLLVNASEYKGKQLEAEQKQVRENAARGRLKGLGML